MTRFKWQDFVQERAMTKSSGATTRRRRGARDASGRVIQTEKFDSVTPLTRSAADTTYFSALASYEPQCRMATNSVGNVLTATRSRFYDAVGRVQYSADARRTVTRTGAQDAGGRRTNVLVYLTAFDLGRWRFRPGAEHDLCL